MILTDKIIDFTGKAFTQLRVETTDLIANFDRNGYQSVKSDELLLIIGETYDFLDLLQVDGYGGLTEREVSDLIDFFIKQLNLNDVVAANYLNYQMPIAANIISLPGSYASAADLAAEIAARIAADQALSDRIDAIETGGIDPGAIFPAGFWDNHVTTYTVVFDDDERLHDHANLLDLDQINGTDIVNIKALTAHFASLGHPGGMHVTQADRDRWDSNVGGGGSTSVIKTQTFIADGATDTFIISNGVPELVNYVSINGNIQPPGSYTLVGTALGFSEDIPNEFIILISYFEDLSIGGGGDAGIYDLTSPSTIAVGGMPIATALTGRTWQSIIEEMAVDYLLPTFSMFDIADLPALVEVGVNIGGLRNFTWNTTNPGNVQPNSIAIRDVTANTLIASALANDGSQLVNTGVIANTVPVTRIWRAEGLNTNVGAFISPNDSVSTIYPFFYGKVASGGAAPGVSRPASNQALIASGTKVVLSSANTITVNFNSTSDDYIWFAIPNSMASKLAWFITTLNNGAIGGAVSPGGNLFPAPSVVNIDSPSVLWNDVDYKIYVSNYQSAVALSMELRNVA